MPTIKIYGIRHHGPGSAHSLVQALQQQKPDIILIEGPPDANALIPLVEDEHMQAPVALLLYNPKNVAQAVFYPFCIFSPEWQAILYSLQQQIPARFIDLPISNRFQLPPEIREATSPPQYNDPLHIAATTAGYTDTERWWEHFIEQRSNAEAIFTAILQLVSAIRNDLPFKLHGSNALETLREAYMRKCIRKAIKEKFNNIAVVCGAWHAPALAAMPIAKHDNAALKGLKRTKVAATFVPWSYPQLSRKSGYGAGITSPMWYELLWKHRDNLLVTWMTRVSRLLAKEGLAASPAHTIEAVHLAHTLAALRQYSVPGLHELQEAAQSVFCFGNAEPMQLIAQQLIIGRTIGEVPPNTPMVPLQKDFRSLQKSLRMPLKTINKPLVIDLRQARHREKSYLLYRLQILGIEWGTKQRKSGREKGTFKEVWQLNWQTSFDIAIIEASVWGQSVYEASTNFVLKDINAAQKLAHVIDILSKVLCANLPDVLPQLMQTIQHIAALSNDVSLLMEALPSLVHTYNYNNVRQSDQKLIEQIIRQLIPRICININTACLHINEEFAKQLFEKLLKTNTAIIQFKDAEFIKTWQKSLQQIVDYDASNALLSGASLRLLFDAGIWDKDTCASKMNFALSIGGKVNESAAWLAGFLHGSGLVLLHNFQLWQILHQWLAQLDENSFMQVLPLLRRTFANFTPSERQQMGKLAKNGIPKFQQSTTNLHTERTQLIVPVIEMLLQIT